MQIRSIVISFWFKELNYNPMEKVNNLENSLNSYLKAPFLINDSKPFINLVMPRIIAYSLDQKATFNLSQVNAVLTINVLNNFSDKDEIVMYVNEKMQLLFDVLKDLYDLNIIYSSIKIEFFNRVKNIGNIIQDLLLKETNNNLEDLVIKRGIKKDNKYYVNYTISTTKEIDVDIKLPEKIECTENDMLIRSMLVSVEEARIGSEIINNIVEINDRLSYNNNKNYRVDNDSLRNLLFEFREIINEEIKKEY